MTFNMSLGGSNEKVCAVHVDPWNICCGADGWHIAQRPTVNTHAASVDRPICRATVATEPTHRPDRSTTEHADPSATQPAAGSGRTGCAQHPQPAVSHSL